MVGWTLYIDQYLPHLRYHASATRGTASANSFSPRNGTIALHFACFLFGTSARNFWPSFAASRKHCLYSARWDHSAAASVSL